MAVISAKATLRVGMDGGSADRVTDLLGLQPSRVIKAGEPISRRNPRPRPTTIWMLESAADPDDRLLADHLGHLCDLLAGREHLLDQLVDEGWWTDWFCFVDLDGQSAGLDFDAALLRRLARLPVDLVLDVYRVAMSDDSGSR